MTTDRGFDFDNNVGSGERRINVAVALLDHGGFGGMTGQKLVRRGGGIQQHRQFFYFHCHQIGSVLGEIRVFGKYHRDRLTDITDYLLRQNGLAIRREAPRFSITKIDRWNFGDVSRCPDGNDAWQGGQGGAGGALFSIAAGIDLDGNDSYRSGRLSQGAAAFGYAGIATVLLDQLTCARAQSLLLNAFSTYSQLIMGRVGMQHPDAIGWTRDLTAQQQRRTGVSVEFWQTQYWATRYRYIHLLGKKK